MGGLLSREDVALNGGEPLRNRMGRACRGQSGLVTRFGVNRYDWGLVRNDRLHRRMVMGIAGYMGLGNCGRDCAQSGHND